jgi:hypothetical protein
MSENNATVTIYDPPHRTGSDHQGTPEFGVRHEQTFYRGQGLSHREACDRLQQCRRPHEGLVPVRRLLGWIIGLAVGVSLLFYTGHRSRHTYLAPLVSWIVSALKSAVIAGELSALGAGLHSIGVLKNNIMEYEKALKSDRFIVIAHGAPNDRAKAKRFLEMPGAAQNSPIIGGEVRQRA